MADYIKREDVLKYCNDLINAEHKTPDAWNYNMERISQTEEIRVYIELMPAADVVERKEAIPIDWIWKHADEFYSASQRHSDAPFSEDAMEDSEYVEAIKARGVLSRLATSYRFELKGADMRGEN